ncbi:MAG: cytochrome C, partial [Gammaproteobacteria bacterium]
QITYTASDDHFSMDNTDVRYAQDSTWGDKPVVWGFTLNNNPAVQDVWNSTPAWSFPFIGSDNAPGPTASPLLAGALAQQVAGLGAYAWLNNSFYGEFTLYRTSQVGSSQPFDSTSAGVISGVAPYWRLAWEHPWAGAGGSQHDLEVGLLGMSAHMFPGNGAALSGSTDDFTDTGIDAQYQYFTDSNSLTLHGLYLHEKQSWGASSQSGAANPGDNLNLLKADASYYWNNDYGPTLAYFTTTGSTDTLLYAPDPLDGSMTGSPDSSGWILQWTWVPDLNVQISAQYIMYSKFNGSSSNYDGAGRNASDNNTLYLAAWLLW